MKALPILVITALTGSFQAYASSCGQATPGATNQPPRHKQEEMVARLTVKPSTTPKAPAPGAGASAFKDASKRF